MNGINETNNNKNAGNKSNENHGRKSKIVITTNDGKSSFFI